MPIDQSNLYYQAGRADFHDGKHLADKPAQYLTNEWELGFVDALADVVRALLSKQG